MASAMNNYSSKITGSMRDRKTNQLNNNTIEAQPSNSHSINELDIFRQQFKVKKGNIQ